VRSPDNLNCVCVWGGGGVTVCGVTQRFIEMEMNPIFIQRDVNCNTAHTKTCNERILHPIKRHWFVTSAVHVVSRQRQDAEADE
jgi:hypothetical protein